MASTAAQASLTSVTTGVGSTVDFTTAKSTVTAVAIVAGSVTVGNLIIEASQDGTNWVALAAPALEGLGNRGFSFTGVAYRYWRATVSKDVVGGGRTSVTFMEAD
jgi:hypothetical protein